MLSGNDWSVAAEEETSPLELAVLENRMDMVQLLIESGADLTHNPEELLYGSLRSRDLTLFSFLIHAGVRIPAKQENIYGCFSIWKIGVILICSPFWTGWVWI